MTLDGEGNANNSTPNTKDVLIARADEQLARVHERIASADEEIARVTKQLSKMERDDARNPSARPTPQGKSAAPGSIGLLPIGLLLAACLVLAGLVSQLSRDGVARIAARWMPQRISKSLSPPTNP